ncbi:MAG: phage tail protein [Elusimicrobia bacterium]|nr:phage tail protein [Elusimicrobiota bacterium]
MPPISFDSIPSGLRTPGQYFEYNNSLAARGLTPNNQKMLIVAQKLDSAPAAALAAVEVYGEAEAQSLFGSGSIAHIMVKAAFDANPYLALTVIPQADAADSVAATGSFVITGPATSSGLLRVNVGAVLLEVPIASADTATDIAAAIAAAITAKPVLPVSASANAGTVTLTAKNKGTLGNAIKLAYSKTGAAGVNVTVTQMASGAVDPDVSAAYAKVTATQFDKIVCALQTETALTALRAHTTLMADYRHGMPGMGAFGYIGLFADAIALSTALNAWRLSGIYVRGIKSLPYQLAAVYAAVWCSESDPARPLNTLELPGIDIPEIADRLDGNEVEAALNNGLTPAVVGPNGTLQIVRAITTYTANATGTLDSSYLDVTTVTSLDYVRAASKARIALRFPRSKFPASLLKPIELELYDVLKRCEELEIVEEVDANRSALKVERNSAGRADAAIPAQTVPGLHVFAGRIDLLML